MPSIKVVEHDRYHTCLLQYSWWQRGIYGILTDQMWKKQIPIQVALSDRMFKVLLRARTNYFFPTIYNTELVTWGVLRNLFGGQNRIFTITLRAAFEVDFIYTTWNYNTILEIIYLKHYPTVFSED